MPHYAGQKKITGGVMKDLLRLLRDVNQIGYMLPLHVVIWDDESGMLLDSMDRFFAEFTSFKQLRIILENELNNYASMQGGLF